MTKQDHSFGPATLPDLAVLKDRFAPLFERIRAGAAQREVDRILPFEQIGWLKESGFTALRVPIPFQIARFRRRFVPLPARAIPCRAPEKGGDSCILSQTPPFAHAMRRR